MVQNARRANLGSKRRDACIDEGVCQEAGVSRVIEDLIDRKQLRHRADLWQVHPGKMERSHIHSSRAGMEVDRVVRIRFEQPIEQQSSVPGRRSWAVLIPGPLAIDVNKVYASAGIRPSPRHAFKCRT